MIHTLSVDKIQYKLKHKTIVNDISMSVTSGEIVGLLGPNGAGKTTSFQIIIGIVFPTSGKVFLDDHDISKSSTSDRAKLGIGYLPQDTSIFRGLSVIDNILCILELMIEYKRKRRKELIDIANNILRKFSIDLLANSKSDTLSGGERRRLEIAKVYSINPKIILLDEPFAGVDPISVQDIQRIMLQLADDGVGILITDHNVKETLKICNMAYILNNGSILVSDCPDKISKNEKAVSMYLGEEINVH